MSQLSLKARLARLLRERFPGRFVASGDLQWIVAAKTDYTPQNVGRRLRELENEGIVEVKYVKGHAQYRYRGQETLEQKRLRSIDWLDALPEKSSVALQREFNAG